jgi:hypothetical protein
MGEVSEEGDSGAKEMKDGPESVDLLVPRDLGGVCYQLGSEVEHTTSMPSCSKDTSWNQRYIIYGDNYIQSRWI